MTLSTWHYVYKRCGKSPEKGIATSTGGRKTTAFNRIVNELLRKQEAEQHKDGDPFIVRLSFSIQLLGSLTTASTVRRLGISRISRTSPFFIYYIFQFLKKKSFFRKLCVLRKLQLPLDVKKFIVTCRVARAN